MSDIDILESVLTKTSSLLDGIRPDQQHDPTPCDEFDVAALCEHMLGVAAMFARAAGGTEAEGFRENAAEMVRAWREHGTDRTVTIRVGQVPGAQAVNMSIIEFTTHGCDLGEATGQDVPFTAEETGRALALAEATLPDGFRGPGKAFAHKVDVPADAPAADRLRGFMGRRVTA